MKRLIFRLSSLGDVILAHSALESPYSGETHWVVAREFESLLLGNPKIHRVWAFDRKKDRGLKAWVELLRKLHAEDFTEIIDLHSTLRTRIARLYFLLWDLGRYSTKKSAIWRRISKRRTRRLAYILLKHFLPRALRPLNLTSECARLTGGNGLERPNLTWLLRKELSAGLGEAAGLGMADQDGGKAASLGNAPSRGATSLGSLGNAPSGGATGLRITLNDEKAVSSAKRISLGLAPSSAWRQKEWPAEKYLQLILQLITELQSRFSFGDLSRDSLGQVQFCLFGTSSDQTSIQLRDGLKAHGVPFIDYVGKLALPEVANALSRCDFVLGADTGLIHLAEAVGVPAIVLYGPTQSDFGFGPSRPDSVAVHGPVRCSPCSKDGTLCYRLGDRYACLRKMKVETVRDAVLSFLVNGRRAITNGYREAERAKSVPLVKNASQKGTPS